ncbi:hypothetical protein HDU96_003073, partial [Phlyctochytrium bullatum]
ALPSTSANAFTTKQAPPPLPPPGPVQLPDNASTPPAKLQQGDETPKVNPAVFGAFAMLVCLLLMAVGLSLWYMRKARPKRFKKDVARPQILTREDLQSSAGDGMDLATVGGFPPNDGASAVDMRGPYGANAYNPFGTDGLMMGVASGGYQRRNRAPPVTANVSSIPPVNQPLAEPGDVEITGGSSYTTHPHASGVGLPGPVNASPPFPVAMTTPTVSQATTATTFQARSMNHSYMGVPLPYQAPPPTSGVIIQHGLAPRAAAAGSSAGSSTHASRPPTAAAPLMTLPSSLQVDRMHTTDDPSERPPSPVASVAGGSQTADSADVDGTVYTPGTPYQEHRRSQALSSVTGLTSFTGFTGGPYFGSDTSSVPPVPPLPSSMHHRSSRDGTEISSVPSSTPAAASLPLSETARAYPTPISIDPRKPVAPARRDNIPPPAAPPAVVAAAAHIPGSDLPRKVNPYVDPAVAGSDPQQQQPMAPRPPVSREKLEAYVRLQRDQLRRRSDQQPGALSPPADGVLRTASVSSATGGTPPDVLPAYNEVLNDAVTGQTRTGLGAGALDGDSSGGDVSTPAGSVVGSAADSKGSGSAAAAGAKAAEARGGGAGRRVPAVVVRAAPGSDAKVAEIDMTQGGAGPLPLKPPMRSVSALPPPGIDVVSAPPPTTPVSAGTTLTPPSAGVNAEPVPVVAGGGGGGPEDDGGLTELWLDGRISEEEFHRLRAAMVLTRGGKVGDAQQGGRGQQHYQMR